MPLILERINPPTGYARPPAEVHTEFPKWLHFSGKPSVLVDSTEEERRVLGGGAVAVQHVEEATVAPVPSLVGQNDELTMLRKIAEERGIHLDGRWNVKKIRAKIEAATS